MKRPAREGFPLISEGEQVVHIKEIDESQYEKFQKISVTIEDAAGTTALVNFNFVKDDGTDNNGADWAYTQMGRAVLGDETLDEIDTDEIAGGYALVEIVHNKGSRGGTFANVERWIGPAKAFQRTAAPASPSAGAGKKTVAQLLAEAKARAAKK